MAAKEFSITRTQYSRPFSKAPTDGGHEPGVSCLRTVPPLELGQV